MEEKYYTSSKGERMLLKDMEYTHLSNALAKKMRDVFTATNDDEYNARLNEINDIKEEIYRRINLFHDDLEK